MKDAIWITWERQPRNRSMATLLEVELHEFIPKSDNILKYASLIIQTIKLIKKKRPTILFVQNPSVVLSTLTCLLKKMYGFRLVVDEHNAGLFPAEGKSWSLNKIARFIVKKANFVIVTNAELKKLVESWGGEATIMPDPLPTVDGDILRGINDFDDEKFNIIFICSWSIDEPYQQVLEAAQRLSGIPGLHFYISGNYKKVWLDTSTLPNNVSLLGFVSENEYYSYLNECSAAVVLTTRENCMTCGAYEAVAFGKPGVLSNTGVMRDYFTKGYLFADSDPVSIELCISKLHKSLEEKRCEVVSLRRDLKLREIESKKSLEKLISSC